VAAESTDGHGRRGHERCADRPKEVYHRKRDSIEAHLTIAFAALAVSRWIEAQTGWSIRKFVKTARRYRTIEIQAGGQTITAADPLPEDGVAAARVLRSLALMLLRMPNYGTGSRA
jgi:hypothetical protein